MSITKVLLVGEVLVTCIVQHLLVLRSQDLGFGLRGHSLAVELVGIKLHDCRVALAGFRGEPLRLVVARLVGRLVTWLPSRFCGGVCSEERILMLKWGHWLNVRFTCTVLPVRKLPAVHLIVLLLKLAHLLDFVQVNDEAGVQVVQVLNALAAEN